MPDPDINRTKLDELQDGMGDGASRSGNLALVRAERVPNTTHAVVRVDVAFEDWAYRVHTMFGHQNVWPHALTSVEFTQRLNRTVTEVSVPTILDFSRLPLEERLFGSYTAEKLPPPGASSSGGGAVVELGLSLVQIERVDLLHGKLDLHVWLRMAWTDQRLRWNAADSQLTELRVPAARLWMPDLGLLNGEMSSSKFFFPTRPLDVTLLRNGTVISTRLVKLSVLCSFTGLRRFPGDTLKCTILFGSPGSMRASRISHGEPSHCA